MAHLYLTRQHDGKYMLTAFKPVFHAVRGAGIVDSYERYGDPIGFRNMCVLGTHAVFKELAPDGLPIGHTVRVELGGKVTGVPFDGREPLHTP